MPSPSRAKATSGVPSAVVAQGEARRRGLEAAERAWARLRTSRAKAVTGPPRPARAVARARRIELAELAAAAELAALDAADRALEMSTSTGDVLPFGDPRRAGVRQELAAEADAAFRLLRVLPIPTGTAASAHLLRVGAAALLAGRQRELGAWLSVVRAGLLGAGGGEAARSSVPLPPLPPLPHGSLPDAGSKPEELPAWDALLAAQLTRVWLDLLRGPSATALDRAFEALGRLREARAEREAAQLAVLPTSAVQQTRLRLQALYALAAAAAALTVQGRHAPRTAEPARLEEHFAEARAASAADPALELALRWLGHAALRIAARQSAQLELPGFLP